jgi:surface antigen
MTGKMQGKSLLAFMLMAAMATTAYAAWSGSPNGFSVGQCTWYADGRCAESGWTLKFSQTTGRDARRWYDLVTNGRCAVGPQAGTIMVLDAWGSNSAGHVAYVESVLNGGKSWRVTHANFPFTTKSRVLQGVQTWQADFEFVPGSTTKVRLVGGSTQYPLRGFIAR